MLKGVKYKVEGNTMQVSKIRLNGLQTFKGWEPNDLLKGKLNNEKELNALSDEAKVNIRSYKNKDSKYLPGHDMYLTTSSKKIGGRYYYASDCLIMEKGTTDEVLSKSIFESAEKSIGKLYGKLAKLKILEDSEADNIVSGSVSKKSNNLFKKLLKIFRK